jgi:hypothetical protein
MDHKKSLALLYFQSPGLVTKNSFGSGTVSRCLQHETSYMLERTRGLLCCKIIRTACTVSLRGTHNNGDGWLHAERIFLTNSGNGKK